MGTMNVERKKRILIDFDGVIHSYSSGWKGATTIPDEPVLERGSSVSAIDWLTLLTQEPDFEVCIYSSRSGQEGGIQAIKDWLLVHNTHPETVEMIHYPIDKGPAWLTIDDRALTFTGIFPHPGIIRGFQPWYQQKNQPAVPDTVNCEGVRVSVNKDGEFVVEFRNYSIWAPLITISKNNEEFTKEFSPSYIRTARTNTVMDK